MTKFQLFLGIPARSWMAVIAAAITAFTTALDIQVIAFGLGPLADAFEVDASLVAWVSLLSLLFTVGFMLTAGSFGDRFGRVRVLVFGLILTTVALAASAFCQNFTQLLITRLVHGIGNVFVVAPGVALIVGAVPKSHRGVALGIQGMAAGVGYFAGPILAGWALEALDWRALFYLRIPIHLTSILLVFLFLRAPKGNANLPIDFLGSVLSMLAFGSLTLAINQGGRLGWDHPFPILCAFLTPLFLFGLIIVERSTAAPILDFQQLIKVKSYWIGIVTHFSAYHIQTGIPILSALLVTSKMQGNLTEAGIVVAVYPLARVLLSPFSGWLSDKLGTHKMIVWGLTLLTISTFCIGIFASNMNLTLIMLLLLLAGMGFVIWEPANQGAVVASIPKNVGTASSMVALSRHLGIVSGVTVATAAFVTAASKASGVEADLARPSALEQNAIFAGVETGFIVIAIIGLVGLAVSALRFIGETTSRSETF